MGNTYCCSDLHGMYDLYRQINEFILPEDKVICLGDCGDRGPRGWRIITEVINNPQWEYLKGNHEDMLAKAILTYDFNDYGYSAEYELLMYNGGSPTYRSWEQSTCWDKSWGKRLKDLPYRKIYTNPEGKIIHLSHAGYNPSPLKPLTEKLCLWDRNHINYSVPWRGKENEYVVHGHTPQVLAHKGRTHPELLTSERYAEGHKINLDCASWYTGAAILFNLDTFEEHLFLTEPLKN